MNTEKIVVSIKGNRNVSNRKTCFISLFTDFPKSLLWFNLVN